MRKASQIVLLVGGILCIVSAIALFVYAILAAAVGGVAVMVLNGTIPPADIPAWVNEFIARFTAYFPEINTWEALASFAFTLAGLCLLFAIIGIPAAVLSFIARNKEKSGLYIACIVLGILSGTLVTAVGGVFGLIANSQQPKEE